MSARRADVDFEYLVEGRAPSRPFGNGGRLPAPNWSALRVRIPVPGHRSTDAIRFRSRVNRTAEEDIILVKGDHLAGGDGALGFGEYDPGSVRGEAFVFDFL